MEQINPITEDQLRAEAKRKYPDISWGRMIPEDEARKIEREAYIAGRKATTEQLEQKKLTPEIVCYCGSLRVAMDAFKKAEYEAVMNGEIALLPCCMFVDIQREYGAESDYKFKADDLHKRKIDISDKVFVLNVDGYIGQSTATEIDYALSIGKPVHYLEPLKITTTP